MVLKSSGKIITSGKIKQMRDSKIEYPKIEVFNPIKIEVFKKQRPDHNYNKTLELRWKNPYYLSNIKS